MASRPDGSDPRVVAHGFAPQVSPNGHYVAYFTPGGSEGDKLYVVGVRGLHRRLLTGGVFAPPTRDRSVAWSPDERYLVVGNVRGRGGYLVDVRAGTRAPVRTEDDYGGASFAPDGETFAIVNLFGTADLFAVRTADRRKRPLGSGFAPVWGIPGLAFAREHRVLLRPRIDGSARTVYQKADSVVVPVDWSADGEWLLIARYVSTPASGIRAILRDPDAGTRVLPGKFAAIAGLSRDGTRVLGEQNGNVVAANRAGGVRVLAQHATRPSWSN